MLLKLILIGSLAFGSVKGHSSHLKPKANKEYVRGCYYTNWAQYRAGDGKYMPENYQKDLCTHILYAFSYFDDAGKSTAVEWNDESEMYNRVTKLKDSDPKLKVLLSYGGYSFNEKFPQRWKSVAQSSSKTKAFIDSAIAHIRKYNFDGFDMDWEYPTGLSSDHAKLVKKMREAFEKEAKESGKDRLLLTAAVSAGKEKIETSYNISAIADSFDYIFLMSYDLHGAWDPSVDLHAKLYPTKGEKTGVGVFNTDYAAKLWAKGGLPKEKLIIGIPTYSRGFTLASSSNTAIGSASSGASKASTTNPDGGTMSYWEVCQEIKNGAKETVDKEGVGAYIVKGNQWNGYDNIDTVNTKMDWLMKEGYGGAFIWTLDFDDFTGKFCGKGKYPIMSAINSKLAGSAPPIVETTTAEGGTTEADYDDDTDDTDDETDDDDTDDTDDDEDDDDTETSTRGDSKDVDCEGQNGPLLPDPEDCHSFYQCSHGKPIKMSCPAGTFYNPTITTCDHEANSEGFC